MRRLYLRDCVSGDTIEDVFVLNNKQFSASNSGKYFIKCFVSDRSAQLTARMWNATRDVFNDLPDGGFVLIRGHIENYQNNLQFIIEACWPPKPGSFEIEDLVPHTAKDITQMCTRLTELLDSLQNRHVAAIVQAYLDDADLMKKFCNAPAAMSFHHAYLGGLLEHTLNAMEVADATVKFYPGLNRDLVLAGIFLHDIAKTWELTYDCAFGYSDGGQLIGHIVKSAMWVEQKAKIAEETLGERIPRAVIDVLQHIILSHHGETEFGSPKTPATPEAIFVHTIENMDAKLMIALEATRGEPPSGCEGNWTEYIKAFGGRLYRPDVAPADVPEGQPLEAPPISAPAQASPANPAQPTAPAVKLQITNPLFETQKK